MADVQVAGEEEIDPACSQLLQGHLSASYEHPVGIALRQIERRFTGEARLGGFGNGKTEIGKVLLDHGETAAALEIGKQAIERRIGKEDIEVTMEKILRFHEFAEVLPALERLRCQDEGIEIAMRAARRSFQALDAALLNVCYRR